MVTTYRLHVNELTEDLIASIKSAFKNKTIEIIVSDTPEVKLFLKVLLDPIDAILLNAQWLLMLVRYFSL